jgi:hypothetical protein
VFDPFGVTTGRASMRRTTFNPMTLLRYGKTCSNGTIVEDAGMIADALVMREPDEGSALHDGGGPSSCAGHRYQEASSN